MQQKNTIEIWGGIECTINRVGNDYHDQLEYAGHYNRETDIDIITSLGVQRLRYPVLWEKHQPKQNGIAEWSFAEKNLTRLKELGVQPIVGLVHHGSGPQYVNFFDGSFEEGLADYARQVAEVFPWVEFYTPVNEPLTTARFCGLYGHWFPHKTDDYSFFKILLSECKATVLAMAAIRKVNQDAKLIQTEDLGKCYSTPLLQYQADMENERRWLSYELLCGRLTPHKPMWMNMMRAGIREDELTFFLEHPCVPYIAGFNYYLTSERYLDEDVLKYPQHYHGGNGVHAYADLETVRVQLQTESGPYILLKEAWKRLKIPLAITECHLHSTREDQMRWFNEMWETLIQLTSEGIPIKAITAWAIFGLYGWNRLVTQPRGDYEPGVFNLSSGYPAPTALARYLQVLTRHRVYYHPVLAKEGWWKRDSRLQYTRNKVVSLLKKNTTPECQPLVILGAPGKLGSAISRICAERNIHYVFISSANLDITNGEAVEQLIKELHPWVIINAAVYEQMDEAEVNIENCFKINCQGPSLLAEICHTYKVKLLTFSTDQVFDGTKRTPYTERDSINPLSEYGRNKAKAETNIIRCNPHALIIRIGSLFSPWTQNGFVSTTLATLKEGQKVILPGDAFISPVYVPDLVHTCLNLILDNENGIFHVANDGRTLSWAECAQMVADLSGCNRFLIEAVPLKAMRQKGKHPHYSALKSEKGIRLPTLESAIAHYLEVTGNVYFSNQIAV